MNQSGKIKTIYLPLISIFLLISCQQKNKKTVIAEFNVNKSLLSENAFVSNTGFSVFPPKNWLKTDIYNEELQKKILYRLDNKLLSIYKSDSTNCVLIISELVETNFDKIKDLTNKYGKSSGPDSTWLNIQPSIFIYKNYEVVQIVFQSAELVVFKLYVHHLSGLYELDYIIPRDEINSKMQSVESSIGSIN
jgi:hypothetical protein